MLSAPHSGRVAVGLVSAPRSIAHVGDVPCVSEHFQRALSRRSRRLPGNGVHGRRIDRIAAQLVALLEELMCGRLRCGRLAWYDSFCACAMRRVWLHSISILSQSSRVRQARTMLCGGRVCTCHVLALHTSSLSDRHFWTQHAPFITSVSLPNVYFRIFFKDWVQFLQFSPLESVKTMRRDKWPFSDFFGVHS